jgi:hypothetical protein
MIVIGVDAHKRTHTLVALDAVTGAIRSGATVQASDDGALNALRFAVDVDPDRCGRSRTAGMSPPGWSVLCSALGSGWFVSHRG